MIVMTKRFKTDRCPVYDATVQAMANVETPEVNDELTKRLDNHVRECPACIARRKERDDIARNAVHPPLGRMTADEVRQMEGYDIPDDLKQRFLSHETW